MIRSLHTHDRETCLPPLGVIIPFYRIRLIERNDLHEFRRSFEGMAAKFKLSDR